MYEKIMKIPDNLIVKYYELCTDVLPDDIKSIEFELSKGKNPRDVKMDLAQEIISLYHDKMDVEKAVQSFKSAFLKGIAPDDIPILYIDSAKKNEQIGERIIDALVNNGFFKSKGEVRRLFSQNAVSINDIKIKDHCMIYSVNDSDILKIGKVRYFKLMVKVI